MARAGEPLDDLRGVRIDTVTLVPRGAGYVPYRGERVPALRLTVTDREAWDPPHWLHARHVDSGSSAETVSVRTTFFGASCIFFNLRLRKGRCLVAAKRLQSRLAAEAARKRRGIPAGYVRP